MVAALSEGTLRLQGPKGQVESGSSEQIRALDGWYATYLDKSM